MEEQQFSPQTPPKPIKPSSPSRSIWIIIVVLFIAAVIYGLTEWGNRNDGSPETREEVASEQAQLFEQRLNELPADASNEQRYSFMLRIARAEYLQENYTNALSWLDRIPEEDRSYQGVWYTYAQIYKAQGDNQRALDNIQRAVEAIPGNPQPWQLYFELASDMSRAEQDTLYQRALAATENDPLIVASYEQFKSQQ
ncbi:MAG TPA: tetratricopeptide repeat protein [Candidatus Doudnabacteria bacterium]|nr:tetratricopeptide repeat protein [Candidatus Doudnabacteria bacterium]